MVILPYKKLVVTVPELNDRGVAFYEGALDEYIGKDVSVVSVWRENHLTVETEETDTLFPYYFLSDIVVREAND